MAGSIEEERLESQLACTAEGSGEYLQLLNDLASVKLSQGNVAGAEKLFSQLKVLRLPTLAAATEASSSDNPAASSAANDSHPTLPITNSRSLSNSVSASGSDDWETKSFTSPVASKVSSNGVQQQKAAGTPADTWETEPGAHPFTSPSTRSKSTGGGVERRICPSKVPSEPNIVDELQGAVIWEGGFDHCIEVYGLTKKTKTSHLQAFLDTVLPESRLCPYIRWADDNHAVLVCGNMADAQRLLAYDQDEYLLQPFSNASQASKQLPVSELLPPKTRPKTSAAVAKKLLSHALGMPALRDRHGEKQLAVARKEAKQDRTARREAIADAWGDDD